MDLIAVVDNNWGIGNDGKLLFNLPPDLQRFKALTVGNVVVMGRKTLQGLPRGAPLADRANIVMSRDSNFAVEGATVVTSIRQLRGALAQYYDRQIYVIGGAEVYRLLIGSCDTAHITKVNVAAIADKLLFNFDLSEHWRLVSKSEMMKYGDLEYTYNVYKRIKNEL